VLAPRNLKAGNREHSSNSSQNSSDRDLSDDEHKSGGAFLTDGGQPRAGKKKEPLVDLLDHVELRDVDSRILDPPSDTEVDSDENIENQTEERKQARFYGAKGRAGFYRRVSQLARKHDRSLSTSPAAHSPKPSCRCEVPMRESADRKAGAGAGEAPRRGEE